MGVEPVGWNITRLKRQNDAISLNAAHARDITIAGCNAAWFARDFERTNKGELTMQTKDFMPTAGTLIERHKAKPRDQIAQELQASIMAQGSDCGLQSSNKVVLELRRMKLRALLHAERRQQEVELNMMGLAFDKHRD